MSHFATLSSFDNQLYPCQPETNRNARMLILQDPHLIALQTFSASWSGSVVYYEEDYVFMKIVKEIRYGSDMSVAVLEAVGS